MSRTRFLLVLLIVLVAVLAFWLHQRSTAPPQVAFAPVAHERLVSTLATNGKVEPSEWAAVRAERPGSVERVNVQKGQQVPKGALLVELDARDARAQVASAEAALAQAKAQLQTLHQGGTETARVEIENELERNRMELATARREFESLKRLADKQAATGQDLRQAAERVGTLEAAIQALERKRGALVGPADRAGAQARLSEAAAALEQARVQLGYSRIHAPVAGVVYDLPVRVGAYLNAGDLVAGVGNLQTLRVRIYVDEPELGRVAAGMPVAVTWDALPGRTWPGSVEKLPTQVAPLGTRQVGEVICTIGNTDLKLLPGTNVNVEITSQVVADGLTIPKEAIRTENGQTGVYVLRDGRVEWRPVRLGAASVTRASVLSGVARGDKIALRTDTPLHPGDRVREMQP
ncbi:MAG TPA: efflux RND transporter periplasmic adaptor subunit [Bryobacteraceae bacterium]|nr:efflux RND transporter periplasmic adaptor subunit [Bryobacteraceae bacterium]